MNKKLRIILPLLSAVTLLASCGGGNSSSSEEPAPTPTEPITSIRLSRLNVGLVLSEEYDDEGEPTGKLIGEECQLEVTSFPRQVNAPKIIFSSSDEKVATVDEKGFVIAVGEGKCEIIAQNEDGSVKTSCQVFVGIEKTKNQANKIAQDIKAKQDESGLNKLNAVEEYCYWNNKRTKNEAVFEDSYFDRKTILSKEEAYFYMADSSTHIKAEGGFPEYTHDSWLIYTNQYYDTYLFHTVGDVKTYMVADSTSFIDQGKSRYQAVLAVLDSLFTAGSSLVTGKFQDAIGADKGQSKGAISQAKSSTRRGSFADGELIMSTAVSQKGITADREDEEDYYIPAETKYDIKLDCDYVLTDNYVKSEKVFQGMSYKLGEDTYTNDFYIESDYKIKGIEYEYPKTSDYQLVDTIFDL